MIFYSIVEILMNTINKALYIGTGLHVEPVLSFPKIKEFVFIDTLPRSEFGDYLKFNKHFYRKNFYSELNQKLKILDFQLIETFELDKNFEKEYLNLGQRIFYGLIKKRPNYLNPTLLLYYNYKTKQYIKYYISTNITLNQNKMVCFDLMSADALIISGYFPDLKLLDFFDEPKKLICYNETSYDYPSEEEEDNIHNFFKEEKYFSNCYLVNKYKINEITEYKNYIEMFKNNFVID